MDAQQIELFKEEYGILEEIDEVVDDDDYEESYEVDETWLMKK